MGVLDDFAELATDFVQEFNNGAAGGTGGADLYLRLRPVGAYDPATQTRGGTPTVTTKIERWSRTAGRLSVAAGSAGTYRRFEEFAAVVLVADLEAAGWTPGLQPDERAEALVGVDGAQGVYAVVACERVMKEKAYRIIVRRDLGPAT